mgnify:CR=1 FL=1
MYISMQTGRLWANNIYRVKLWHNFDWNHFNNRNISHKNDLPNLWYNFTNNYSSEEFFPCSDLYMISVHFPNFSYISVRKKKISAIHPSLFFELRQTVRFWKKGFHSRGKIEPLIRSYLNFSIIYWSLTRTIIRNGKKICFIRPKQ